MSEAHTMLPVREKSIRTVATAALAGTSIEWYDFFLYGTAAALVFPRVFFSSQMPPLAYQLGAIAGGAVAPLALTR